MAIETLVESFDPQRQGESIKLAASSVRGLRLFDSYRGQYTAGKMKADLRLDGSNQATLEAIVRTSLGSLEALTANLHLPGNLRFAIGMGGLSLLANLRILGAAQFAAELASVGVGLRTANGGKKRRPDEHPLEAEEVHAALKNTHWDTESIVHMGDAWELRPRLAGQAVPVRLTVEGPELHVQRVVIDALPENETCRAAVATQSLRFNTRAKYARLASTGNKVVVDARIHRSQLDGDSLTTAGRAVAVVERNVCTVLQILATHEEVAERCSAWLKVG